MVGFLFCLHANEALQRSEEARHIAVADEQRDHDDDDAGNVGEGVVAELAQVFAVGAKDYEERHDGQKNRICGLRDQDELSRAFAPGDCHNAAAYQNDGPDNLELGIFEALSPAKHAIDGIGGREGSGDCRREACGQKAKANHPS